MTGYYRKFCKNFSCVAAPLTNLVRKDQVYHWDEDFQKAFMQIKALLLSAPVLVTPDYQKPFKLQVDASDYGAGAGRVHQRWTTLLVTFRRNSTGTNAIIQLMKRKP